jgi:hypothetical protein
MALVQRAGSGSAAAIGSFSGLSSKALLVKPFGKVLCLGQRQFVL